MKWRTIITEKIGCEYPILLGAFARFDNTQLTASISKAGGCGILTGSYFKKVEKFRNAILEIKKITNNPFGINLSPNKPLDFKKDLDQIFSKHLEIAKEEKIKTIITVGPKVERVGKKIKEYGMIWIHKVTTMKHAVFGEKMGADAVILTGLEGAGLKNPKQNTLFINMVNAKRILKVPIIASGGISNGRGMLGALILGAQAVHICTAFLATAESPISESWKQKIIEADCFDPEFINKTLHFESEMMKATPYSLAAGTIDKIISAEDLVNNIIVEAEIILKNLGFQEDLISFI
ncbi:MAG: NAD(P)H-dependent flavin oxidoreductase [Promethearchaeota archaeon]